MFQSVHVMLNSAIMSVLPPPAHLCAKETQEYTDTGLSWLTVSSRVTHTGKGMCAAYV